MLNSVDVPIDMEGLPHLVDAPPLPAEFVLFPPAEETPPPRRQPHFKKKVDNHIPHPPNAFVLFRSSFMEARHTSTDVETNYSTLSKIVALTWHGLPKEEHKVWQAKAKKPRTNTSVNFLNTPLDRFRPRTRVVHIRDKAKT
ncbi:hypothetical protein K443DRAFT_123610 [Laccaria amethystina LaAM-08-1]|uniref:HMG box domain-containing protein n=1 Tax=Laccaria amethystina LaAM-08-1 TaxID=1095629 RepID=A0A0C9XAR1_9AGAR|nr:hypothetical protein K443DRAFT_123610 [Laccaria amethystina LaAM-08-1]